MSARLVLNIYNPHSEPKISNYLLEQGQEIIIGRAVTNPIVVANPYVSREHVALRWQGEKLIAKDLGSKNGTRVNELLLHEEEALVNEGDRIELSNVTVTVLDPTSEILHDQSAPKPIELNPNGGTTIQANEALQSRLRPQIFRRDTALNLHRGTTLMMEPIGSPLRRRVIIALFVLLLVGILGWIFLPALV